MIRRPWFDEQTGELAFQVISSADSWQTALADGIVTQEELQTQTQSVTRLLRTIDERVDDDVHNLITELLQELSVLHAMQLFYAAEEAG
ncbi:hypothetical protein [Gloeobacter kilaueensis]|uniref:Uncharacterized protein n=1 Tax=Gloeobacter kilaueensis (strain ATCC BAA-2537 / CCAP 1431/1 / ULC 316 / JS1) TaxID=1183438 RepID=U5QDY9_GLOK1|nr:hypothetical protein [Gloeobacter kilaueensis]AGY57088.1 hypothetical protein GKIL_0842 [Gloeobacter kilaueensis JS1]